MADREPFEQVADSGELRVSFRTVTVDRVRAGRGGDEAARIEQRERILQAALTSVQQHGAAGLKPEKVVAVTNGSISSQSMRRAFKSEIEARRSQGDEDRAKLRAVLEDHLVAQQLDAFDRWLKKDKNFVALNNADAMVTGLVQIADALLRNTALVRLRTTDRDRLLDFLTADPRAELLVDALADLAARCLVALRGPRPDTERLRVFVRTNLHLLADDIALLTLASPEGAKCFVGHMRRFATK